MPLTVDPETTVEDVPVTATDADGRLVGHLALDVDAQSTNRQAEEVRNRRREWLDKVVVKQRYRQRLELKRLRVVPAELPAGMLDPFTRNYLFFCRITSNPVDGFDFSESVFDHCDFFGIHFHNCRFTETVFTDCTLQGVEFDDCDLSSAHFVCQELRSVTFHPLCDLSRARFSDLVIRSTKFKTKTRLSQAELENVRFSHCDLSDLDLRGARISRVVIDADCDTTELRVTQRQFEALMAANPDGHLASMGIVVDEEPRPRATDYFEAVRFAIDRDRLVRLLLNTICYSVLGALLCFTLFGVSDNSERSLWWLFFMPTIGIFLALWACILPAYSARVRSRWNVWHPILESSR